MKEKYILLQDISYFMSDGDIAIFKKGSVITGEGNNWDGKSYSSYEKELQNHSLEIDPESHPEFFKKFEDGVSLIATPKDLGVKELRRWANDITESTNGLLRRAFREDKK